MNDLTNLRVANKCCVEFIDYFEDQQKTHTFVTIKCHDKFGECRDKSFCLKIATLYKREIDKRREVEKILNATRV